MHKKKAPHETVVQNVPVGSSVRSWAADVEENIGNRDYNEDRWIGLDGWREDPTQGLFAVLDGHGGSRAVDFVIEGFADVFAEQIGSSDGIIQAITRSFRVIQSRLGKHEDNGSGATCSMCYVANGHLHFANVGDSKAFIVTETEVIQVSVDHKASNPDEVVRVEETDGQIINGRINGIIAVTRSFGDSEFKEDGLIAIPYIHEPIPITPDLRCAIIASDGIWDMVNAVELLPLINEPADTIAQQLMNMAIDRDSTDNITILVLKF